MSTYVVFDAHMTDGDPTPGRFNASIGPFQLRLNPDSVNFSFDMKVARIPTIGGMVVQVYGIQYSDVVVTGSFGTGGWEEQAAFFQEMHNLALTQAAQPIGTNPTPPLLFSFPDMGYRWQVYIKDFSSPQGMSIVHDNTIINPQYTLTLFVAQDLTSLKKVATDAFIARLSKNFGWTPNQFNGPSADEVQKYLNSQGGAQAFLQNILGGPSTAPSTLPTGNQASGATSATTTSVTAADGQTATVSGPAGIGFFLAAIMLNETSGGHNDAPTASHQAAGYYQFEPGTWAGAGGTTASANLATFQVQTTIAAGLMSSYYNTYGSWYKVAEAWLGGPGSIGTNNADSNGKTVTDYASAAVANMRKLGAGQPLGNLGP